MKAINLGKLYFLPKIHKRLSVAVTGRPAIFNCGTPTEKVSEYLDILKHIMQDSWSYIKDSAEFLKKNKNIGKIPEGAILVSSDFILVYLMGMA